MRWNRRERSMGEAVAIGTFVAGLLFMATLDAGGRVRPGMTRDEVTWALGTSGGPHPTKLAFMCVTIKPQPDAAGYERQNQRVREFFRKNGRSYVRYQLPLQTVDVDFVGAEEEERVQAVESHRSLGWMDWNWHLAGWACGCVISGMVAAEQARRSRTRSASAGPSVVAPDGATQ